ncbi:TonB-dependent receptor [Billgrantia aerodenitrificans]|uniref:TonB-dependent hemoglobin/transferrin/lactoferrin family receptor n=1 Tax=Billgrantia aerodenitrificans TaxID=2733483 RepID=A0ABS9AU72_9GAMM|nr:TonB-dependent receptor [Halomonas aerodenitrificans]MCE8025254.1 TonB-dependent hemoglobin/transferrin/lactoferrin family receptor [Halomonas aerodenitrificans]
MQHEQRERLPGVGKGLYRKVAEGAGIVVMLTIFVILVGLREAHGQTGGSRDTTGQGDDQTLAQQRYRFDLPEQSLLYSLGEFTAITNISVLRPDDRAIGGVAPALQGEMTADEALRALLMGSGLAVEYRNARTAELVEPRPATMTTVGDQVMFSTLTVTAGRLGDDWVYHEPRSVSVIPRERIDRLPPRHAADMLLETPGVYSAVNTQDPALSVNIRGMQDFGRVNTMIDGMRQNFNENAHQQRNGNLYVDSELLSEVVVAKGPTSDVHGAGAIAGSANFRTLDYDDIIMDGNDAGVRLRANTGLGGEGNGVNFIGSLAAAGRFGDNRLELLGARSRRSLGEYSPGRRGESFDWLMVGVQDGFEGRDSEQVVDRVKFTDQTQESNLFKARLNLTPNQALQFTYLDTEISYNNVSDRRVTNPSDGSVREGDEAWLQYGDAQASSHSIGLDYTFNPGSDWIDLAARVYRVSTENERYTREGRPVITDGINMTEEAWRTGRCDQVPFPDNWQRECEAGLGSNAVTNITTHGLTLENTARFALGGVDGFRFNHGIEYFQDRGDSNTEYDHHGSAVNTAVSTLQPNGRRSIASAFGNLVWENETYTLGGGLRYDYYRLKGDTRVPGVEWNYITRQEQFDARFSPEEQQMLRDMGWYDYYYNLNWIAPKWEAEYAYYEYEVNNREDNLLPTLQAAYRPTDWLELFAGWGESWRPPALTESLMEGSHPSDPFAVMFPNPYAEPETSRSWEVGFNTVFQNLLLDNDRLLSKVAYYDTEVDNYLITSMVNIMPGRVGGLGRTMFVNNQVPMKFRGIELELDYDARRWYTRLNYTHVLGGDQNFCQYARPLGSHYPRYDMPDEDGNFSEEHQWAIDNGYDSYEDYLDQQVICAAGGAAAQFGMNSARNVPMDRGSWVLGMRLFDERLDMGTRLNYSAEGKPEDFEYAIWPSYTTWDLYASYRINQNVLLRASVENLRDQNYVTGYSDIFSRTYAPGRTAMAGVELQF